MKLHHALLRNSMAHPKGSTLLELLIVLSILGILCSAIAVVSSAAYKGYALRMEEQVLVSVLGKARSRALARVHQSVHGVCYSNFRYIIFEGTQCIADDPRNEYVPARRGIAELSYFQKNFPVVVFSWAATTTPSIIHMFDGTYSETVTINYEGAIFW